MLTGNGVLIVDLGNSETRVMTIFGKTQKGLPRTRLSSLRNSYADLPEGVEVSDDYNEDNSKIFNFKNGKLCTGDLCQKEYEVYSIRPTCLEKKYESDISVMSLHNAFLQGFQDISEMSNVGIEDMNITWDVTVLLPPADVEIGGRKMADVVKGIKMIDFDMPKVKMNINIRKVRIVEEGFCAFIGVLFDQNKHLRKEYDYLMSEKTLVLDIGAGTTDIVIVDHGKIVSSSRFTISCGGNNIHQKVRMALWKKGISLPDEEVREGVVKGYVKDGKKTVSISQEIASAKDDVARTIVSSIRDFFEASQYPIRTIENLLFCGGGSSDSVVEGVKTISEYLYSYIMRLSENIQVIDMPKDKYESPISPRMLNILGAGVLSII